MREGAAPPLDESLLRGRGEPPGREPADAREPRRRSPALQLKALAGMAPDAPLDAARRPGARAAAASTEALRRSVAAAPAGRPWPRAARGRRWRGREVRKEQAEGRWDASVNVGYQRQDFGFDLSGLTRPGLDAADPGRLPLLRRRRDASRCRCATGTRATSRPRRGRLGRPSVGVEFCRADDRARRSTAAFTQYEAARRVARPLRAWRARRRAAKPRRRPAGLRARPRRRCSTSSPSSAASSRSRTATPTRSSRSTTRPSRSSARWGPAAR